jgi:hypothetical protein
MDASTMKPVLFLAAAALLSVTTAAAADNGQRFDEGAQLRAYGPGPWRPEAQCFRGKSIAGVTRAGERTVYVQSRAGAIYRLELAGDCAALDAATKVTLRGDGGLAVCPGTAADLLAQTPAGPKQCRVAEVRRMGPSDLAALSAPRR